MPPGTLNLVEDSRMSPPSVFLSYSHKDERWRGYLQPHIQQLEKIGLIRYWDDRKIDGGDQWYGLLKAEMDAAAVAVCLISAKYLASNFCLKEEVPHLLERRQQHGLAIIPVLLDHCGWEQHQWLQRTQLLPGGAQPLSSFKGAGRSKQLQNVADCINQSISRRPVPIAPEPSNIEKLDLSRLPKTGAEIFGRDHELRILDEAWSDDTTNLVTLTGPGGVGKSALVNCWLGRLAREGYRGARKVLGWSFFNQGSGQRFAGADEFVHFALAWFGDPDPDAGSPWDKGARLARLLRSDRALIVLDGLEALQSDTGDIRDPALSTFVLQSSGKYSGLCIMTSRVSLGGSTATNLKAIDLQLLSVEAGRALLRVNGVQGTDEALERAAKSFGRHALGVKLLSAYLACTSNGRLTDAVIPEVEGSDDEGRQPLRVMAALASVLGNGPERELLDLVALFDRPADGAALRALRAHPAIPGLTEHLVAIDETGWVSVVNRLRTLGLIAAENAHEPDVIDAHPLVREYFGDALFNVSPVAWRAGHRRLYDHFLESVPDQPSTLDEMVPLFQAIRHGCNAGQHEHAWRDVFRRRIQREWDFYGTRRLRAWGEHLAALVNFFDERWSRPAAALGTRDGAFVLYQSGVCLRAVGHFTEATRCLRAALDLSLSDADWAGAAVAASNLSETELLSGDLDSAVLRGRQGVVFADQSGDPYQRSGKRTTLADALHQLGHMEEAEALFAAAYRVTRGDGTVEPMPQFGAYRWCELLLTARRTQEAAEVADRCLATGDSNPLYVALHQMIRGIALLRKSDSGTPSPEAISAIEEAVRGLRQSGNSDMTPRGLLARAELRMRQGAIDAALGDADEAMLLATRVQMPLLVVDAHLVRASIFEAAGRIPEARALIHQAHESVTMLGYGRRHADLAALGERLTR